MKLLREPLFHFLLLGAGLFGVFALIGNRTSDRSGQIIVASGLIENLKVSFVRNSQRPPTAQELDALIEDYIREEVLCREAKAIGLDRDDPIVRRQLRKRMEFVSEDSVETTTPSDDELRAVLQKNPEAFRDKQGRVPELAEAREAVQRVWLDAQRKKASDAAYQKLRAHYTIKVEQSKPSTGSAPMSLATTNTTTTK